jgi:hypothetical protein
MGSVLGTVVLVATEMVPVEDGGLERTEED